MRLLGAHMSVQGGVHRAMDRGAEAGCDALQVFTKSSNQWKAKPLSDDDVALFRERQIEHGISPVVAHDCYLINLGSPDPVLHARSAAAFAEEIDRCDLLGLPYLIAHPGAHMGSGEDAGIGRIAGAINAAFRDRPASRTSVLLETTAGMGTSVGHRFEQIASILDRLESPGRGGVCVDTCHVFAAGYDISNEAGYHAVMEELDRTVGLSRVRAFHLNDSKKGLGCRLDRHEHIGAGALGVTAFWCLLNDPRFDGVPMVLETPKGDDLAEDKVNLALLRAQIGARKPVTGPKVRVVAPGVAARPAVRRGALNRTRPKARR
jgi:deoxyribonuclease IV